MARRRGGAASIFSVRGVVGLLVGMLVTMLIGFMVVGNIISSVNTDDWAPEAVSAWNTLTGNIWMALGLLVILPIVVGAVVLLMYIGVLG